MNRCYVLLTVAVLSIAGCRVQTSSSIATTSTRSSNGTTTTTTTTTRPSQTQRSINVDDMLVSKTGEIYLLDAFDDAVYGLRGSATTKWTAGSSVGGKKKLAVGK